MPSPHEWTYAQSNATHYVFSFALFKVSSFRDRSYFKAVVTHPPPQISETATWYMRFSNTTIPRLNGAGSDPGTQFIFQMSNPAEMPYKSETINNPVDGLQTYYFYRVHVWLREIATENDVIEFSATYNSTVTLALSATSP